MSQKISKIFQRTVVSIILLGLFLGLLVIASRGQLLFGKTHHINIFIIVYTSVLGLVGSFGLLEWIMIAFPSENLFKKLFLWLVLMGLIVSMIVTSLMSVPKNTDKLSLLSHTFTIPNLLVGLWVIGFIICFFLFLSNLGLLAITWMLQLLIYFWVNGTVMFLLSYDVIQFFLITWILIVNDSFAYLCGYLWGKKYIFPSISPKKTLKGYFGGGFFSLIWLFAFIFMYMSIQGKNTAQPLELSNIPISILAWVVVMIFGNAGDLFFSALKRSIKQKDYSGILSSHGGIFDRIDSALIGTISFIVILTIILKITN